MMYSRRLCSTAYGTVVHIQLQENARNVIPQMPSPKNNCLAILRFVLPSETDNDTCSSCWLKCAKAQDSFSFTVRAISEVRRNFDMVQ